MIFRSKIASISGNVVVLENIKPKDRYTSKMYQERLMEVPAVSPKCRSPKRALDSTQLSKS